MTTPAKLNEINHAEDPARQPQAAGPKEANQWPMTWTTAA